MSDFNRGGLQGFSYSEPVSGVEVRPLMRLVYLWMMFGLLTTAAISWVVSSNTGLVMQVGQFWIGIVILEFVVVLALSWGMRRIAPTLAGFLFFLYSALNGLTFGVIFAYYVYTGQGATIGYAFLTTAGLFGAMTVVGFVTNIDLTKFGSFLLMGLIGLIIAMVVNIFVGSGPLDFVISIIGVLIFTGLTAYDTQRIKEMATIPEYNQYGGETTKLAIFGALQLYLDFINIFLFLLRLFGGSRD